MAIVASLADPVVQGRGSVWIGIEHCSCSERRSPPLQPRTLGDSLTRERLTYIVDTFGSTGSSEQREDM